jgi:peptide methionine sulfoxide reductase msrA/msrB
MYDARGPSGTVCAAPQWAIWVGVVVMGLLLAAACVPRMEATGKEHAMDTGVSNSNDWRQLTPEEARVIVHKGTERPGTGPFENHKEPGTFVCRRCGAALYRAEDKFASGCGWPSFDAEVAGAVQRAPDADRIEIRCATCQGHLGHLFTGEHFTPRDTRHCVNSISLDFVPLALSTQRFARAIFAGGCFWGVQSLLQAQRGVIRATAGYTGGHTEQPTYAQVCAHNTGHAEAVELLFDPKQTSFELLARLFFEIHDPTQQDRQGPDVGDQYRSAVFYTTPSQQAMAQRLIAQLRQQGLAVVTEVTPATTFWPAEAYHQDYYRKNGQQPYCHRRVKRF